jgi:5-methylcytosine-specific restriction protein A
MAWSNRSRQARGYGKEWQRVRLLVLQRDCGLCQCPDCRGGADGGRLTLATEVDHIIPKAQATRLGWTQEQMDDMGNLRSVAHACHVKLTEQQQGKNIRPQIGLDGWPLTAVKGSLEGA